ncbi:hypothetical protein LQV05_005795 [Cryptococcus neoformans]|nr:hypothetical protein J007_04515 [Cryptococcus neoformans var. grubii]OXC59905.1 hypothetical protein C358_04629 [Cryptococcus neoformans var. grubii MW-RSA852]UOH83081.1 hypothetical protein LQV05_005795 [Cryptococcus neoformans]
MGPSGLVISKLGIQATASDTHARGLICLKVSLPKESPGRPGARWMLFNSTPPALVSQPTIHPLPLPLPSSQSPYLRIASTLLSLPHSTSYPPTPSQPSILGGKPYIDVSSTTGKVFVVVDSLGDSRRRGSFKGKADSNGSTERDRKDWLVAMEFQQVLESSVEDGIYKVLLPLPRCLDNVIRLQILSPSISTSSMNQVSVLTEPKMLPLPASAFDTDPSPYGRDLINGNGKGVMREEGWEDGEDLEDEDYENADQESSWLEGRFQSTDILRLEWSFTSTMIDPSIPSLSISPKWDKYRPSMELNYTAVAPGSDTVVSLEVDVPEGWGWAELIFESEGLAYWRGVEGNFEDEKREDPDRTAEYRDDDSFATVRPEQSGHARRRSRSRQPILSSNVAAGPSTTTYLPPASGSGSSISLMRQTLPTAGDAMDEFSFEMSSEQSPAPKRPNTPLGSRVSLLPTSKPSAPSKRGKLSVSLPEAKFVKQGKFFDLYFNEQGDRAFSLRGVLVPISNLALVSQYLPCPIPLVSLLHNGPTQCNIQCNNALYLDQTLPTSEPHLISIPSSNAFFWSNDSLSNIKRDKESGKMKGDVRIRLRRDIWGVVSMSVLFAFPRRGDEVGFTLYPSNSNGNDHDKDTKGRTVRVTRASMDGQPIPRCLHRWQDGKTEVRIGKKEGRDSGLVEIILEIVGQEFSLPTFEDAEGMGLVELCGESWEAVKPIMQTTLTPSPNDTYSYPLSTLCSISFQPSIVPQISTSSRARTLFSFSTFFNLFMLWLLLSMGSQIQRLRNEVSYVAGEARDLRMYGYNPSSSGAGEYREGECLEGTLRDGGEKGVKEESAVTLGLTHQIPLDDPSSLSSSDKLLSTASPQSLHPTMPNALTPRQQRHLWAGWDKLVMHPTVKSLTKGVAWLWHAVVWLVVPPI